MDSRDVLEVKQENLVTDVLCGKISPEKMLVSFTEIWNSGGDFSLGCNI